MRTNCLVTKLKGVVSNNNLKELGVMYITLISENSAILDITSSVDQDIIASEGDFLVSGAKSKTLHLTANTKTTVYSTNNTRLKIKIPNKYAITYIDYLTSTPEFNIDDLGYSMELSVIRGYSDTSNITGNLKYLKNKVSMITLVISRSKVTGKLSDISNLTYLTSIAITRTEISGDIKDLSSLTKLTTISLGECQMIYGTLESLVAGQVSNGRTTGSISMGYLRLTPNVTFNGVNPNDDDATLTWKPNSTDNSNTDVSYNGVTITINANGNKVG